MFLLCQEIYEMKYGMRFFGYCADMRLALTACFSAECFLSDRSLPEYVRKLSRVASVDQEIA